MEQGLRTKIMALLTGGAKSIGELRSGLDIQVNTPAARELTNELDRLKEMGLARNPIRGTWERVAREGDQVPTQLVLPEALTITRLAQEAHQTAQEKGWYDQGPRPIPELLVLIHAEVSEAVEDYRNDHMEMTFGDGGKPEGFPSELADVMIRTADAAAHLRIDLEAAVKAKLSWNRSRPYRHGGKKI